jgi:phosphoribosylaminoimidazole-succinocarboxamide synthase
MGHPTQVDPAILSREPDVRGSVQDLYRVSLNDRPYLLARTTESGSVFDVGTIFSVPRSGVLRTAIRHSIYTALADPATWRSMQADDFRACFADEEIAGALQQDELYAELLEGGMRTHHVGIVDVSSGEVVRSGFPADPSNVVLVEEFPVFRPKRFGLWGHFAWDYAAYFAEPRKIVALEQVFRLGAPGGSALLDRYRVALERGGESGAHEFLESLGLESPPRPWSRFPNMIYDAATKYEPQDRHLSWQEALHLSGVPGPTFRRVILTVAYSTVFVAKLFREAGFELWDIKWEAAVDGDEVIVVDTMDPDSIRLTGSTEESGRQCFFHFNKQAIRDYYRLIHDDWYASINEAKERTRFDSQGRDFMQIYREGVASGQYPGIPTADERFQELQSAKYQTIADALLGKLSPHDARSAITSLMQDELDFYRAAGRLERFLGINSVPA